MNTDSNSIAFALRRLTDQRERFPERHLFAAVVGSHAYGFASPESDIDVREVFMLSPRRLLGICPPPERLNFVDPPRPSGERGPNHVEVWATELLTFARRIANANADALETIYSPLSAYDVGSEGAYVHKRLRELALPFIRTQETVNHYGGYYRSHQKRLLSDIPNWKLLCHIYRSVLTGLHAVKSGELCLDIESLATLYGVPEALEAMRAKVSGQTEIPENIAQKYQLSFGSLYDRLITEATAAQLPSAYLLDRSHLQEFFWDINVARNLTVEVRDW